MTTLKAILDAIDARIEAKISGTSFIKGYPAWDRPYMTPPVIAGWFTGQEAQPGRRIGQGITTYNVTFQIAAYAIDELAMFVILDSLRTAFKDWTRPTISGVIMRVSVGNWQRLMPDETAIEKTRYAVGTEITFSFEEQ